MSSSWPMVPLGEVLQLQRRWVKLHPTETYREIGIRSFGNGIFHKAPIQGSVLGNKRVLRIEPGDLVFNNVFAWEGGCLVEWVQMSARPDTLQFLPDVQYTYEPKRMTRSGSKCSRTRCANSRVTGEATSGGCLEHADYRSPAKRERRSGACNCRHLWSSFAVDQFATGSPGTAVRWQTATAG
jgi:hypothetical protein